MDIFVELSVIVLVATLVSVVMKLFKQPLVVGYILTGILVGPYAFDLLHATEDIEFFAKMGVSILLFIVGLNLNPDVIKEVGKVSVFTGIAQVLVTTGIGFGIMYILGYDIVSSLYAAIALTFSSTIIILKLLSDRGDLDKLYGKISIGILLVQDIVATLLLVVVSAVSTSSHEGISNVIILLVLKGIIISAILYIISKKVLPKISTFMAGSQELLFLFSIAWGLGLAAIFFAVGFSIEIGALIAGVTLSVSPFAYEIGSRMKPLRDFFIVIFFVLLGYQMVLSDISNLLVPAMVLSLFVLIAKPIIVFFIMDILGYRRRVGFLTGLTMAQVSEFSLILMSLALVHSHIDQKLASLITLVAIISIAGSTYFILNADKLFSRFDPFLKSIELRKDKKQRRSSSHQDYEVVVFGYDRVGNDFVRAAEKLEKKYIVVDFNPTSIKQLQEKGIPFKYGDADDVEFLGELNLSQVKLIVSTIPDFKTSMLLVRTYRQHNLTGIIMVLSHDIEHAEKLYLAGASYVVMPHYLGAHYASQMIAKHGFDIAEFERERNLHLQRLAKREAR